MTDPSDDLIAVRRRLLEIERLLTWLAELGHVTAQHLEEDWRTRLLVERLLERLVELAVNINMHLAVSRGGPTPRDYRSLFPAAAQVGAITPELAERLAPSAGLRNIVVHQYLDVDLGQLAAAVPLALDGFSDYTTQVARFLRRAGEVP